SQATTSKFDLSVDFFELESGLQGSVEYATDLFDGATIERLSGNFKRLLEEAAIEADRPISELPLLSEAERRQVREEWNATETGYPREKCVHELFEAQVEKNPEAVAMGYEDEHLSYGELNRRANRLAHYLMELGVKAGDRVGVCLERSMEMMVGQMG